MNSIDKQKFKDTAKFILQMARNDFKVKYAGAYLGLIWSFVQPIITILIYWFVFQVGFKTTPVQNVPYIVWFICGIIPWFFISDCVLTGMTSILEYAYVVKKVIFNVRILPIVKIVVATFIHCVFLILMFLITWGAGTQLSIYNIQVIYYSLGIIVLCIGFAYLAAALVPFLKDMTQIVSIIMQFGFWLTPIVWNYEVISPQYLWILKLNPAFYIIQGYRDALIGHVWFWERPLSTLVFWFTAIAILVIGVKIFDKLRPHFADVL
ncbi:MAG: ABC transporter permease [Clostridiales bacterium]|nr:ABC transporter permease [Clostridiales bacterium]